MIRPLEQPSWQGRSWCTPQKLKALIREVLGPLAITGDGVEITHPQPGEVLVDARPVDDLAHMPFRVRPVNGGVSINPGIVRTGAIGDIWMIPVVNSVTLVAGPTLGIAPGDEGYVTIRYRFAPVASGGAPISWPWECLFVPLGELLQGPWPDEEERLGDFVLAYVSPGIVVEQSREGTFEIF